MRDRRPEDRENTVAGRLHDVAVVATHRVDHQLQCRVNNRARFLGVEILLQLGRALDVREQRRDNLALAFGDGRRRFVEQNANRRSRFGLSN